LSPNSCSCRRLDRHRVPLIFSCRLAWAPVPLRKCRTERPDSGREIQPPETAFRPGLRRPSAEWKSLDRRAFQAWNATLPDAEFLGPANLGEPARPPEFLQSRFLGDRLGRAGGHPLTTGRAQFPPDPLQICHGRHLPFPSGHSAPSTGTIDYFIGKVM